MATHNNYKMFKDSAVKNDLVQSVWLQRLTELAMCAFEWKNVPDTVNIRYVEKTLNETGSIVFCMDDVIESMIALKPIYSGGLDIYGNPVLIRGTGYNGYQKDLSNSTGVIVWNNYLRMPTMPTLINYSRQLADIDRTIEVNLSGQKTPKILQCTKSQYLTMKNIELKVDGNQKYVYLNDELNPDMLKVIDMTVPYLTDKLLQAKTQIWAEALSYIGIPANAIEKAERINALELELANASTNAQRYTRLLARQDAARQINKMFGTNITVDFRFKGGENNDGIYSTDQGDSSKFDR